MCGAKSPRHTLQGDQSHILKLTDRKNLADHYECTTVGQKKKKETPLFISIQIIVQK